MAQPSSSKNAPVRRRSVGRVVALTGAASFLGRNLIGVLEEDPAIARIVAIDVETPPTAGTKTRLYEVDLTQPGAEVRVAEIFAADEVDTVVHLAFLASPSHAQAYAHELESVGTMRVITACRSARVRKLVQWSTTLLYGALPTNPNFLSERHPLRADQDDPFFADKIAAEVEANRYGARTTGAVVTILRTAPILGPTVKNYLTRYLARKIVPTMMGFDPLMQFVHEVDAIAAFKRAIDRDVPGTFNIAAEGVLPLSTVVKLSGRLGLPVPHPIARTALHALWVAQLAEAPSSFIDYLRFLCVSDGEKARREFGFVGAYTTREALVDFTSAQRLRDVRLLHEPTMTPARREPGSPESANR
ncbi:MAG: NAD-dependent epimerase/dehydratase family protein [Polyangiales bacterium]